MNIIIKQKIYKFARYIRRLFNIKFKIREFNN